MALQWFLCVIAAVLVYGDHVEVQLSAHPISIPISSAFASFSYEISGFIPMVGKTPRASFVQLLENLRSFSNASGPTLRIGGNSADVSWWNPNHLPRPKNITYDITDVDINAYKAFLAAAPDSKLVIDTSLYQADNASWAVNHLRAVEDILGWQGVEAVEIGNECDIFYENGLRSHTYNYSNYKGEFNMYAEAIKDSTNMPQPHIQGGTFCCNEFNSDIPSYLANYGHWMKTFSYHTYPTSFCHGVKPSVYSLLDNRATEYRAQYVASWVAVARNLGIDFVMGETNSCSCGGATGVSDVFASALWAVDYLFSLASVNVSKANFHGGSSSIYTPIAYKTDQPDVRPLYYAMLAFSEASAKDSVILKTSISSTNELIRVWAVKDGTETHRVVCIHKDVNQSAPAQITVTPAEPGDHPDARLVRMVAKDGFLGKYGVSWAGQTFDGSVDGKPVGQRVEETVKFSAGAWTFSIYPGTVAMLTL